MQKLIALRNELKRRRAAAFEAAGMCRYSWLAAPGVDEALQRYAPYRDGFFIEAGAADGTTVSNTYFLERCRGWRGVLVEPVASAYHTCVQRRPASRVYNYALVGTAFTGDSIEMRAQDSLAVYSYVQGVWDRFGRAEPNFGRAVTVPARTLTSILDEVRPGEIDLLSLDVEGFETEVLDGLDFDRYRPRLVLVEIIFRPDRQKAEIEARLGPNYVLAEKLGSYDYLYIDETSRGTPSRDVASRPTQQAPPARESVGDHDEGGEPHARGRPRPSRHAGRAGDGLPDRGRQYAQSDRDGESGQHSL